MIQLKIELSKLPSGGTLAKPIQRQNSWGFVKNGEKDPTLLIDFQREGYLQKDKNVQVGRLHRPASRLARPMFWVGAAVRRSDLLSQLNLNSGKPVDGILIRPALIRQDISTLVVA